MNRLKERLARKCSLHKMGIREDVWGEVVIV